MYENVTEVERWRIDGHVSDAITVLREHNHRSCKEHQCGAERLGVTHDVRQPQLAAADVEQVGRIRREKFLDWAFSNDCFSLVSGLPWKSGARKCKRTGSSRGVRKNSRIPAGFGEFRVVPQGLGTVEHESTAATYHVD